MSNYPGRRWKVVIGVAWGLAVVVLAKTPAYADESHKGTLVITVQNEDGSSASNANIYIFGGAKNQALLEVRGSTAEASTFVLPPGTYKVYAGCSKPLADAVDHYATPEARIRVNDEESTSLILKLSRHIVNDNMVVSESTLRRMGLSVEMAQRLD